MRGLKAPPRRIFAPSLLTVRAIERFEADEELARDGVLRVITRTEGDCFARFAVLLAQVPLGDLGPFQAAAE